MSVLTAKYLITRLLLKPSSVFGGAPAPIGLHDTNLVIKAMLIGAPLQWMAYYLRILLYSMALVVTAKLVEMAIWKSKLELSCALHSVRQRWKRIAVLSLKIWLLVAVAAALMAIFVSHMTGLFGFALTYVATYRVSMIFAIVIAWFAAPWALPLFSERLSASIDREKVRWARLFTILAVAASSIIALLANRIEDRIMILRPFLEEAPRMILESAGSLLAAIPYIVLFVILSLLATENDEEVSPASSDPDVQPYNPL
jgi:hypothetical protein